MRSGMKRLGFGLSHFQEDCLMSALDTSQPVDIPFEPEVKKIGIDFEVRRLPCISYTFATTMCRWTEIVWAGGTTARLQMAPGQDPRDPPQIKDVSITGPAAAYLDVLEPGLLLKAIDGASVDGLGYEECMRRLKKVKGKAMTLRFSSGANRCVFCATPSQAKPAQTIA